jgi:hypothetical protein
MIVWEVGSSLAFIGILFIAIQIWMKFKFKCIV